jgi:predicted deacylase
MIAICIILILILITIKLVFNSVHISVFSKKNIKYYDYIPFKNIGNRPHKICFIAGVHGNEPAGSVALYDLIKSGYFATQAGKNNLYIRVIPTVNTWGIKYNNRYQPNLLYPDINRNFIGTGLEYTSKHIIKLINNFDLVVDFHEGWGFHLINSDSVGSTISPSRTNLAISIANNAVDRINKSITCFNKKFMVLYNNSCEISKTLACFRECQGKHYILVETSGQNNLQSLNIRKKQIYDVIEETLNYFNLS